MLRLTTVAVAAFASAALFASTARAEPPSSDPALCANGGWQSVQSENGHRFPSEDWCVGYARAGHLLFRPRLDLIPRCFESSLEVEITASGFHQASLATITVAGATWLDGSTVKTQVTGTDQTSVGIPGGFKIQPILAPPLYSTSLVTITVRDAEGVNLTASTLLWCAPVH